MEVKERTKLFINEMIVLVLFLVALRTKQQLMILPLIYICIFIVCKMPLHYIMAISIFCVPFSNVFKISLGTISLLSIVQLLYIGKYIIKYCKEGNMYLMPLKGLILWVFMVVSTVANGNFPFMRFVNFFLFFVMLYIEEKMQNKSHFFIYGNAFSIGTIASCVVGSFKNMFPNVIQFISQIDAMRDGDEIYGRFMALTEDPNILSAFILFSIAIVFVLYFNKLIKFGPFILQLILLVFFGMLTYSKMFLLGSVLIVITVILLFARKEYKWKILIISLFVVLGLTFAYKNGYFELFLNVMEYRFGVSSSSDFSSGRFDIWILYYQSMNEKIHTWLIGYGIRGGMLSYKASHNSFVQVVYSMGIIGFYGYISYIRHFIWNNNKNRSTILLLVTIAWSALSVDVFDQDYFYYILIIIMSSKNFIEKKIDNQLSNKIQNI